MIFNDVRIRVPIRMEIVPDARGNCCLDINGNGVADRDEDQLVLNSYGKPCCALEFEELTQLMRAAGPAEFSEKQVTQAMAELYGDDIDGTSVNEGPLDLIGTVSSHHAEQSFAMEEGKLFYILRPDSADPFVSTPPSGPAVHIGKTLVERDGALHWTRRGEPVGTNDRLVGELLTPEW